eukprot:5842877-Pyramimonas_sp.AAC.1
MTFTEEALERMTTNFHDMRSKSALVHDICERSARAPVAPDPELQRAIEDKAKTFVRRPAQLPWWVPVVAGGRDRFVGAALVPIPDAAE